MPPKYRSTSLVTAAHPCRAAGPERGRVDRRRYQREAEANRYLLAAAAIRCRDDAGSFELPVVFGRLTRPSWPVVAGKLDPGHERRLRTDEVAQFVGDRAEHLGWPRAAGDEGGHPSKRGLLVGNLP